MDFVDPPASGGEAELRQPVMPDMSKWTLNEITYGTACAD